MHQDGLKATDKALIIIGLANAPVAVDEIRASARDAGLGYGFISNLGRTLSAIRGQAICTTKGWELHARGRDYLTKLGIEFSEKPTATPLVELRRVVSPIGGSDPGVIASDAIACLENGLLRPGIVFSWIGAVAILYEHVAEDKARLKDFNAEATRRFGADWKVAKNADDLARMKEANFLLVLEAVSIIGKNVKGDLEDCLKLRNACGHPNSLKLGEHRAAAHLDTLLNNVYVPFGGSGSKGRRTQKK